MTCAVPLADRSLAASVTCSCVLLTNVVGFATPFTCACDDAINPLPVTVTVVALPTSATDGETLVTDGVGLLLCCCCVVVVVLVVVVAGGVPGELQPTVSPTAISTGTRRSLTMGSPTAGDPALAVSFAKRLLGPDHGRRGSGTTLGTLRYATRPAICDRAPVHSGSAFPDQLFGDFVDESH